MTDEAWIEQSLARLEALEAQQGQYEAAGQPVPAELSEEIAGLYEALESAAGDDEAPAAAPAPAPADPFAVPASAAPVAAQPVAAAPAAVAAPMMDDYGDDDFKPKGKGGLIAVAAVAVLAVGGGGYWYMSQQQKPAPKPEPQGEAKVISASSVPEDTQEPQAAKGGSADKTPGTEIPEASAASPRRGNNGGGGGKRRPRNNGKKKDDGRKVKVNSDDRDPLGGI